MLLKNVKVNNDVIAAVTDNDGYSLGELITVSKQGKQILIESRPKFWLPLSDGGAGYRKVMHTTILY